MAWPLWMLTNSSEAWLLKAKAIKPEPTKTVFFIDFITFIIYSRWTKRLTRTACRQCTSARLKTAQ
jgi:hypothetical protein